jgi:hypothetical protein
MPWKSMVMMAALITPLASCETDRDEVPASAKPAERLERAQEKAEEAYRQARDEQDDAIEADEEVRAQEEQLREAREEAAVEKVEAAQAQAEAHRKALDAEAQAGMAGEGRWWTRADVETTGADRPVAPEAATAGTTPAALVPDRVSLTARVLQRDGDQLQIARAGAEPLTMTVDAKTTVQVDGQPGTVSQLTPGTEIRILYRDGGEAPVAELVDVRR